MFPFLFPWAVAKGQGRPLPLQRWASFSLAGVFLVAVWPIELIFFCIFAVNGQCNKETVYKELKILVFLGGGVICILII
jgi:hypothetical protein